MTLASFASQVVASLLVLKINMRCILILKVNVHRPVTLEQLMMLVKTGYLIKKKTKTGYLTFTIQFKLAVLVIKSNLMNNVSTFAFPVRMN